MSRLVTIDLGLPQPLFSEWKSKGLHIPYEIFDLFTKLFCPQSRCRFSRITILLGDVLRLQGSLDTCEIETSFDWENYQLLSEAARKLLICDLLVKSLTAYSNDLNIESQLLADVETQLRSDDFCWTGRIGSPKISRSSADSKASLMLDFRDVATVSLDMSLACKRRIKTVVFSREVTENYWLESICKMFHSIRWQNDTHVLIYQENARDYWSYDINESELTFHYPRAESGEPQGEFELGLIYLSGRMVTMDREKAVYWIKRAADKGYKHAIRKLERLIGPTSVDQG